MKTTVKAAFLFAATFASLWSYAQEKKTHSFTIERQINASAEAVWAVVGEDFGAIANSHPKIVSSNYINGSLQSGEGAERQCNFDDKGKKYVKEKQLDYDPKNYQFKVQIFHAEGLPMDQERSYAIYKVVPIDADSCRLVFDMTYRTKPAFMGALAKGNFKKTIGDYLLAVDHHVKTQEVVNQDNFKIIKKKYKS